MSGRMTAHHVAHGRGSDPTHCGWLQNFSNEYESLATSRGAYVTGDFYNGKYGYSLRLSGLDPTNSNALGRAIVVHSAWYAEPEIARSEEHTSELQSLMRISYAVFCLKKKKI